MTRACKKEPFSSYSLKDRGPEASSISVSFTPSCEVFFNMTLLKLWIFYKVVQVHSIPLKVTWIILLKAVSCSASSLLFQNPSFSMKEESVSHSVVSESWNHMDCSPPGSSVHGILQARILDWATIPFSRGSSQPNRG